MLKKAVALDPWRAAGLMVDIPMDGDVRRKRPWMLTGAVLLVMSHGLVLWMGFGAGKTEGEDRSSKVQDLTSKQEEEGEVVSAEERQSRLLQAQLEELRRRGRERVEAWNRRGGELEYAERNGEKLVLAEREKIPADADLKALVEKGAREGIRTAGIDSEAVAAFGLWLEKDMAAAMGWLAAGAPYQEFRYFSVALGQWLGQGQNHTQLAALLERYPAAAELLLEGAAHLADKRGAEFRFAIAKSLADPDERMEFIARALDDVDFVKSHMAELAGYVKGGLEDRFLDILADAGEKEVMREAMRKAGLSPGILSKFEARGIAEQVLNEEPELVRPQETASSLAETAKALEQEVAESVKDGEIWRTRPRAFDLALPDFGDWCDEVKEGRMSADELLARTKAAWPAEEAVSAGLERDLRTLVFRGIYRMDPVAGLRWYRAGGGNVAGQLGTHVSNLQAEQIVALLKEVPDLAELVGEDFKTLSRGTFAAWGKDDPAGYRQAMEELGELGKGSGLLWEEEEQR